MVGAADQGARLDVVEAHIQGRRPELHELVRRHVALHGKVVGGRAQVLAEGQNPAADIAQVSENVQ